MKQSKNERKTLYILEKSICYVHFIADIVFKKVKLFFSLKLTIIVFCHVSSLSIYLSW